MTTRIIICGGRDFNDRNLFYETMDSLIGKFEEIELVSGHAKGADSFAEAYAKERNIPITVFKPDWKKYGRGAGPIRNREMLQYAIEEKPVVMAFWDGKSKGTKNMLDQAKKAGAECLITYY